MVQNNYHGYFLVYGSSEAVVNYRNGKRQMWETWLSPPLASNVNLNLSMCDSLRTMFVIVLVDEQNKTTFIRPQSYSSRFHTLILVGLTVRKRCPSLARLVVVANIFGLKFQKLSPCQESKANAFCMRPKTLQSHW